MSADDDKADELDGLAQDACSEVEDMGKELTPSEYAQYLGYVYDNIRVMWTAAQDSARKNA